MFNVRIQFEKKGGAACIFHLDLMKTLQRALLRPSCLSNTPRGSTPTSTCLFWCPFPPATKASTILCDFGLLLDSCPDDLAERLNRALPQGLRVTRVGEARRPVNQIGFCGYEIHYHSPWDPAIPGLFEQPVKILKHSKRGDREVVLNDYVRTLEFRPEGDSFCCTCQLKAGDDPLNPSYITDVLRFHSRVGQPDRPLYIRKSILDKEGEAFF